MEEMCQPLDFYGSNTYGSPLIKAGADGKVVEVQRPDGFPLTAYYLEMTPETLYWTTKLLHERYQLPIVVTENGAANCDWVAIDGKVHDPQRQDLVHRYLRELGRAISEGVDIRES